MKKHFRIIPAFLLSFCCLLSTLPIQASVTSSVSFKTTVEDALAQSQNAQEIYRFLINDMGLNSAAACGVLANIRRESSFSPLALGDSGTSYGICQWHDTATGKGRYTNLINWCSTNGYDYTTIDGQLHFLKYELSQNNSTILYNGKTIYNKLLSVENTADGAYEAGYYWCNYFEIPYSNNPSKREAECIARGTLARDTYWPAYCEPQLNDAYAVTDGLAITWSTFTGALSYELYRYENGDSSTITLVAETTETSVIDTTVISGTSYTYILCALVLQTDGTVTSVSAKEITQYYLAAPTLTKCTGSAAGQSLKWTNSAGATEYVIYRSENKGEYTPIATTDTRSYKDTTATASGVRYSYQIVACRKEDSGSTHYSLSSNAIANYTLAAPNITSVAATDSGFKIKWDKVAKATSYAVYRSVDGGKYEEIAVVTKKSYTDTTVKNGTSVKYKVYACYTGSLGQTSKHASSATKKITYLKAPTLKKVTAGSASIRPSWSRSKKASGYEIMYSKSKSFKSGNTTLRIITNDTTAWTIKSLKKGTTYYVRVRSYVSTKSGKSYSAWSDTMSCKTK